MTNFLSKIVWLAVVIALLSSGESHAQSTALIDDKTYDFGLNPIGTVIHHTFILKNTGKKSLAIQKVSTTCDCTKVSSYPKEIGPGEQGEIVAVMDHHHAGYTDVSINVQAGPNLADLYVFRLIGVHIEKQKEAGASPDSLSAKEALQLQLKAGSVALIDSRPINLYVQAHAKGSQNVQPFALEGRQDLKAKTVILIGEGADDPKLLSQTARLKSLGFKEAHFLAGGLRAWQMAGGTIEGSAPPQSASLALINPSEFYSAQKGGGGWAVIDLDNSSDALPTIYPAKHLVWNKTNPVIFSSSLNEMATSSQAERLLVTSSMGSDYDQLEASMRGSKLKVPVYYLQGGSKAYLFYMHQQTLALASRKITVKGDQAYLASAKSMGQVIRGAGCGSCGH